MKKLKLYKVGKVWVVSYKRIHHTFKDYQRAYEWRNSAEFSLSVGGIMMDKNGKEDERYQLFINQN
jgi:hypothetical protein